MKKLENYAVIPLTFNRARIIRHDGHDFVYEGW
jgi:hypothetical protein